jgi:predicted porin
MISRLNSRFVCAPLKAAVAGLLLASGGAALAQSSVTLFGVVDLGVRYVKNSQGSLTTMNSGSNSTSRWGLRGEEDLGGGLKSSFWLESTIAADTGVGGTGSTFWDRRATLSLSGNFGELRLGRDYTPMFRAYASADTFGYVGAAGMGTLYSAAASNVVKRAFGSGTTSLARTNNAVQYYTPAGLGGFYANAMISGREAGTAAGDFDFHGLRLGYSNKGTDVSVYTGKTNLSTSASDFTLQGVVGTTKWNDVKITAGLAQMRFMNAKQSNFTLGAEWPVGQGAIRAIYHRMNQSGMTAANVSVDGDDAQALGLGYVHNLSKRTAVYGTAMFVSNKGNATFAVPGGASGIAGGSSSRGYEVGLRHNF